MKKLLAIMIALTGLVARADGGAISEARPNILFIFTDDHAQHAISCYGSKVNSTPHLDRLAADGVRFTNSFVTNSICSPSRATLLTGQYSHKNGVPVFNAFDGGRDHVAKHLQAAGYQDDGLYADSATWPKTQVDRVEGNRPALGEKTVVEAIHLTARQ